ncbi:hypothetical protein RF11_15440 [Thelohanellus kitauei]|uniref:Uncharacterized protein n=1 Tax=Thelohanellus kitauei TaxID=669202 RepID=A0A0C2IGJ3_THEKT|nr:hypothetical protein RF11_15440 [Thelohanellus kitauei]
MQNTSTHSETSPQFRIEPFDEHTEDWSFYEKKFAIALRVHGIVDDSHLGEFKRDLLMKLIGQTHFRTILENFNERDYDTLTYDEIIHFLRQKFEKVYVIYQRYTFNKAVQEQESRLHNFYPGGNPLHQKLSLVPALMNIYGISLSLE